MVYVPKNAPGKDPEKLQAWIQQELEEIQKAFSIFDFIMLKELHSAPVKTPEGITVLADGTNWNPGAGAGVYTYYGAAWHKLG